MLYIVTVKVERDPSHDPRNKKTSLCAVSRVCTDSTGEHHSVLVDAATPEVAKEVAYYNGVHVTRVEEAVTWEMP